MEHLWIKFAIDHQRTYHRKAVGSNSCMFCRLLQLLCCPNRQNKRTQTVHSHKLGRLQTLSWIRSHSCKCCSSASLHPQNTLKQAKVKLNTEDRNDENKLTFSADDSCWSISLVALWSGRGIAAVPQRAFTSIAHHVLSSKTLTGEQGETRTQRFTNWATRHQIDELSQPVISQHLPYGR